jgi:hypothetical protein
MNWFDFLRNPNEIYIKKYMFDILQSRYVKHEKFLEALSKFITTKEELENFGKLVADIYESGFLKAFNDYKNQIEKLGLKISISAGDLGQKSTSKIFKNQSESEKSG